MNKLIDKLGLMIQKTDKFGHLTRTKHIESHILLI